METFLFVLPFWGMSSFLLLANSCLYIFSPWSLQCELNLASTHCFSVLTVHPEKMSLLLCCNFGYRDSGNSRDKSLFSRLPEKARRLVVAAASRPFWAHLCYILALSFVSSMILQWSPLRNGKHLNPLDALFTSVSAVTVSSLGSVPMQDFSQFQLILMTLMMFVGSEVFTSMLCLHLRRSLLHRQRCRAGDNSTVLSQSTGVGDCKFGNGNEHGTVIFVNKQDTVELTEMTSNRRTSQEVESTIEVHGNSVMDYEMGLSYLGYTSLFYIVVVHLAAILLIILYFSLSRTNQQIVRKGGINISIFAVFTVVSSFANCGFTPLDDNMMSFRKDRLTLFIIGVVILLGNTLYASTLWAVIWILGRLRRDEKKKGMYEEFLKNGWKMYDHLFPATPSFWLVTSNLAVLAIGSILLCSMQWNGNEGLFAGLDWQHKVAASLFQALAMRHAGENVVNPLLIHPAVVLFYIIMMYLPGYLLCWNAQDDNGNGKTEVNKQAFRDAKYLTLALLALCITERNKLITDPLNYKVLNIAFEVVSGYGNVGMSIGYSCELFNRYRGGEGGGGICEDEGISFSGKWSALGKLIIMSVMVFGRLKSIRKNPISVTWLQETKA